MRRHGCRARARRALVERVVALAMGTALMVGRRRAAALPGSRAVGIQGVLAMYRVRERSQYVSRLMEDRVEDWYEVDPT